MSRERLPRIPCRRPVSSAPRRRRRARPAATGTLDNGDVGPGAGELSEGVGVHKSEMMLLLFAAGRAEPRPTLDAVDGY